MEYLANGSLDDEAKGAYLPLTRAKRLIVDVLRGLEHAHHQGILHRDIKPANILIGNYKEGKLSDFGLAFPIGVDPAKLAIREYAYVLHQAPEINRVADYSVASDIYACGMTLYRMINGDSILKNIAKTSPGLGQAGKVSRSVNLQLHTSTLESNCQSGHQH